MLGLGNSITGGAALEDTFLPSQVSDLSLWLDNGVGITAARWDDSSGNNNHIVQSTGGCLLYTSPSPRDSSAARNKS